MARKRAKELSPESISSITKAIGTSPLLPGESKVEYERGLSSVIEDLGATTATQVYLAEKIFECLWWIRRYENQKRMMVVSSMVELLRPSDRRDLWGDEPVIVEALTQNRSTPELKHALAVKRWTIEMLTEQAMHKSVSTMAEVDRQIELYTRLLTRFQASYELNSNRKLNTERMMLQNELLKRDLKAIEHEPTKALPVHDEQPSPKDR